MSAHRLPRPSSGFTLAEVLVAIALLAVVSAVLVPTVTSQVVKGEQRRLAEDLRSVGTATTAFYVNVGRWPGSLRHLARRISTSDRDIDGKSYPEALADRWNGPYLARGDITGGLETGYAGRMSLELSKGSWGESEYLRVAIGGVPQDVARRVSAELDGDTLVGSDGTGDRHGAVRWVDAEVDSLVYFLRPLHR